MLRTVDRHAVQQMLSAGMTYGIRSLPSHHVVTVTGRRCRGRRRLSSPDLDWAATVAARPCPVAVDSLSATDDRLKLLDPSLDGMDAAWSLKLRLFHNQEARSRVPEIEVGDRRDACRGVVGPS